MEHLKTYEEINWKNLFSRNKHYPVYNGPEIDPYGEDNWNDIDQSSPNFPSVDQDRIRFEQTISKYVPILLGTPYTIGYCRPSDSESGDYISLTRQNEKYPDFSILGSGYGSGSGIRLRVDCKYSPHRRDPYFVDTRYIEMPDMKTTFKWIKNHWYTAWRAKNDGTRSIKESSYGKNYMFKYIASEDPKNIAAPSASNRPKPPAMGAPPTRTLPHDNYLKVPPKKKFK